MGEGLAQDHQAWEDQHSAHPGWQKVNKEDGGIEHLSCFLLLLLFLFPIQSREEVGGQRHVPPSIGYLSQPQRYSSRTACQSSHLFQVWILLQAHAQSQDQHLAHPSCHMLKFLSQACHEDHSDSRYQLGQTGILWPDSHMLQNEVVEDTAPFQSAGSIVSSSPCQSSLQMQNKQPSPTKLPARQCSSNYMVSAASHWAVWNPENTNICKKMKLFFPTYPWVNSVLGQWYCWHKSMQTCEGRLGLGRGSRIQWVLPASKPASSQSGSTRPSIPSPPTHSSPVPPPHHCPTPYTALPEVGGTTCMVCCHGDLATHCLWQWPGHSFPLCSICNNQKVHYATGSRV